jgi:hypothetical protein
MMWKPPSSLEGGHGLRPNCLGCALIYRRRARRAGFRLGSRELASFDLVIRGGKIAERHLRRDISIRDGQDRIGAALERARRR